MPYTTISNQKVPLDVTYEELILICKSLSRNCFISKEELTQLRLLHIDKGLVNDKESLELRFEKENEVNKLRTLKKNLTKLIAW